jgi:2-iminobutanoate/2-iminopropanoate deaminase
MKKVILTDKAPKPVGPYSQGIHAGDFIFVAGQVSIDPQTGQIKGETIEEQTKITLQNVQAILEAGGTSMGQVVKVTAVLNDMVNFEKFNSVYKTFFPTSAPPPARICYAGSLLGAGKLLVEIDAIAYVGPGSK